jgi:hypothetical protein
LERNPATLEDWRLWRWWSLLMERMVPCCMCERARWELNKRWPNQAAAPDKVQEKKLSRRKLNSEVDARDMCRYHYQGLKASMSLEILLIVCSSEIRDDI